MPPLLDLRLAMRGREQNSSEGGSPTTVFTVLTSLVVLEGVRGKVGVKASPVSLETMLDLRRRRITRLIRFDMVSREWSESDVSESLDELLSELDVSSQLATGPGVASSSIMCCGVDKYMYEWEINWKSRYMMYTSRRTYRRSASDRAARALSTHHAGAAADFQGLLIGKSGIAERRMERRLSRVRLMSRKRSKRRTYR